MDILSQLEPSPVWFFFEDICKIPRLSKNEEKIRKYLLEFAGSNGLESKEDKNGNILIVRDASPGMENRRTVVLQSHMDMVGEKNADHQHNWSTDPIVPVIRGEWVTASGTTLGADDGIGVAAQLAILSDKNLKCGKIECLFTTDEESGMTGAKNLSPDYFSGRILINLDSEDEGILFIGCAGGIDTIGEMKYNQVPADHGKSALLISVTGLRGGHSGDEIHKGYGNAVKLMARLLKDLSDNRAMDIAVFDGGNARNAIPRESFVTIMVDRKDTEFVKKYTDSFYRMVSGEYGDLERDFKVNVTEAISPPSVMDRETQKNLLNLLNCCPHGVLAWSKDMKDLVETSTNLASVKSKDGGISIVSNQRSSVESSKYYAASMVESCMRLAGAEVTHSDGYPGWKPNLNSQVLRITRESYLKLFGKEPEVKAIHAGLECGLIYENINDIDMISFGPTIKGAHTPEEMMEIKTAQMFWDLLIDVIKNIPEN